MADLCEDSFWKYHNKTKNDKTFIMADFCEDCL